MTKRQQGFSLIELMITLGIASLLLGIAVPAFNAMSMNGERDRVISDFRMAASYAHQSALSTRSRVVICPSTNSMATTPSCMASSRFNNGYISFIDADANNTFNNGDELLSRGAASPLANYGMATDGTIVFLPTGMASTTTDVLYCDRRGSEYARVVTIQRGGNVAIKNPEPGVSCT